MMNTGAESDSDGDFNCMPPVIVEPAEETNSNFPPGKSILRSSSPTILVDAEDNITPLKHMEGDALPLWLKAVTSPPLESHSYLASRILNEPSTSWTSNDLSTSNKPSTLVVEPIIDFHKLPPSVFLSSCVTDEAFKEQKVLDASKIP
ncbi:hypothetical protein ILUMI_17030 [Ignelater luminosus]|uniref:Uncharacterized protein n=1 Tax=Ignelater luminosus TaxID=2038154 RepID=A0A8K0CR66_IGNLU|nr:hypothetical protein ILUMI_17030 [Ignelater luminosus]